MSRQTAPEGEGLAVVPITLHQAHDHVDRLNRRHRQQAGLFALACSDRSGKIRGVAIVGQPTARMLDDGWTCEVTRWAASGDASAYSILYRSAWRAARALGYRRLVTYTRATEPGASLRAAGFRPVCRVRGESHYRGAQRECGYCVCGDRVRWEITRASASSPRSTSAFPLKPCLRVLPGGLFRPAPPTSSPSGEAA